MHEVAAMRRVVSTVLAEMGRAGASRVTAVELVLRASGHLSEDAAHQYWALFTRGTPAQDASIGIIWTPATYQCVTCLLHFASSAPFEEATCPHCGGAALELAHEDACSVRSLDVVFGGAGDFEESDACQS